MSVADLAALAGWLTARGLRPVAGWSTHPHWDHLLWSRALGDAPRYATPSAVAVAARDEAGLISGVEEGAPGHDLTLFARVQPLLGHEIDWPGPRALIYAHDAHAPGHGAVFLPDSGVLIAGDMCSDVEIPLLDLESSDPFGGYREGLRLLADVPGVKAVVPGHGHVGDAAGVPPQDHRRLRLPGRGAGGRRHRRPAPHRRLAPHRARPAPGASQSARRPPG